MKYKNILTTLALSFAVISTFAVLAGGVTSSAMTPDEEWNEYFNAKFNMEFNEAFNKKFNEDFNIKFNEDWLKMNVMEVSTEISDT